MVINNRHSLTARVSLYGVIIVSIFLGACSNSEEEAAPASTPKEQSSGTGVIPKHQIDTLNRAKAVDAQALDADEKRRKQLEAMQ